MKIANNIILFVSLTIFESTSSARILGVFPFPSKSHSVLGNYLLTELAKRGHQVTMLSSFPLETPHENYTDLVINLQHTKRAFTNALQKNQGWNIILTCYDNMMPLSEAIYQDKAVLDLINSNQEFDIIIYLNVVAYSLLGFSHRFNASTVIFTTFGANHFLAYSMNLPHASSYVPNFLLPYAEKMTFWQRLNNLYTNTIGSLQLAFINEPFEEKLLQKHFLGAPALRALMNNVQLVLMNSHPVFETIRPTFQNIINIGGFNLEYRKPLSKDIQEFLNESKTGVIYICFGSNIKFSDMPSRIVEIFLESFSNLPFDILWAIDGVLPKMPPNVKIYKWVHQASVLHHRNIKLFITHAGRGSINEAIYYGIPMLQIPFYFDQKMNAVQCVESKIALSLDLKTFTKEQFFKAIDNLIYNSEIKENLKLRSFLIRHEPVKPMDSVDYWIRYLAQYKDVKFLKSAATAMPWYKLIMIDVISFLAGFSLILLLFFYCILKKCLYFIKYVYNTKIIKQKLK